MKNLLISSGYPRSGNTYLNQALNLLYYPDSRAKENNHTVVAIQNADTIIVPFRNPLDSIASWHKYPSWGTLEEDVKYYTRFYTAVLNNLSKVVLMDFDKFIQDIEFIKLQVFTNYNLTTNKLVTNNDVKMAMLVNGKEKNLPRNNKEELDLVKSNLKSMPEFQECLDLYVSLKS